MSINTLTIIEDNQVNGSNLVSVHNPLAFICEAFYSGQTPHWIYVDVIVDGDKVGTYKAVAYKDITGTHRQFAFFASDTLKQTMLNGLNVVPFDDFGQSAESLDYVPNLTRLITITFRDPEDVAAAASCTVDVCHAASQIGDKYGANMYEQYNNHADTYYCANGGVCYVYFYNDNPNNVLSINGLVETFYAIDANDDIFTDSNDDRFII